MAVAVAVGWRTGLTGTLRITGVGWQRRGWESLPLWRLGDQVRRKTTSYQKELVVEVSSRLSRACLDKIWSRACLKRWFCLR